MMSRTRLTVFVTLAALAAFARPALAGAPLTCFPFDIGTSKSLPMGTGGWKATDPTYNLAHLVDDTVALLADETPVIVRMETLRRATLYAATNPKIAAALLDRLQARAAVKRSNAPLAVFDFGYLVETYRQASMMFPSATLAIGQIDGYQLVLKAAAIQRDPAMEFAAAVITQGSSRTVVAHREHLSHAVAASKHDATLATNIASHFAGLE